MQGRGWRSEDLLPDPRDVTGAAWREIVSATRRAPMGSPARAPAALPRWRSWRRTTARRDQCGCRGVLADGVLCRCSGWQIPATLGRRGGRWRWRGLGAPVRACPARWPAQDLPARDRGLWHPESMGRDAAAGAVEGPLAEMIDDRAVPGPVSGSEARRDGRRLAWRVGAPARDPHPAWAPPRPGPAQASRRQRGQRGRGGGRAGPVTRGPAGTVRAAGRGWPRRGCACWPPAAAVVSFTAQYRMVDAAPRTLPVVAALEAAIPDAAALVFASPGHRAGAARAAGGPGPGAERGRGRHVSVFDERAGRRAGLAERWRSGRCRRSPTRWPSDTLIGVVRAWAIARQQQLGQRLADEEATPLAIRRRPAAVAGCGWPWPRSRRWPGSAPGS